MSAPTTEPAGVNPEIDPELEVALEPELGVGSEAGDPASAEPNQEPAARRRPLTRAVLASDEPAVRPVWLVAPLAALWAAGIGLVVIVLPMLVLWAISVFEGMGVLDALDVSGLLWLASHDVALRIGPGTYSLLPWGLMLLWLALLVHAGGWAARSARLRTVRDGAILVVISALTYGALLAVVSAVAVIGDARTSPIRAFGIGFVLAAVGVCWGALRGSELGGIVRAQLPPIAMAILRGALAAVVTLLGIGTILVAIGLMLGFGDAMQMQQFLNPGPAGGFALLILGLGYLPVAVLWAIAYALGAGIAIGPQSVLSPFLQTPAPTDLPAFPLLAALPQQASMIAWALPLIGVVAGIVAGLVIARSGHLPALQRLGVAIVSAACAALVIAILTRMSFGSLGTTRLVGLGPSSETVALIAGALLCVGSIPAALVAGRHPKAADEQ